jgi:uncharacterized RDD family membrane protein YckC
MRQKTADLMLLIQAGLLGFAPILALILMKSENYRLYRKLEGFLMVSKISWSDRRWIFALLITITAAIGIAIYYNSGKLKRGALLCLSAFALIKCMCIIPIVLDQVVFSEMWKFIDQKEKTHIILTLLFYALMITISLLALLFFAKKDRAAIKSYMEGSAIKEIPANSENILEGDDLAVTDTMLSATKEKRFVHYLVDSIIIILVMSPVFDFLFTFIKGNIYDRNYDRLDIFLSTYLATVFYYAFFELLFHSTPGKYLTQCRVISENGDKPNIGQVIGRSFCRLIPFEHFSFLGNRGWHDSITRTDVAEFDHKHYQEV